MNLLKVVARTWLTGLIYCLAGAGYVFYFVLILVRTMQRKKILLVLLTCCIALLAAGAVAVFVPMRAPGVAVEIVVPPGLSVRSVAQLLEKKRIVASARLLVLWIKIQGSERQIQAGRYFFREYEGVVSASRKLRSAHPVFVEITIPEGLTIEQTASRYVNTLHVDSAAFVAYCYDSATARMLGHDAKTLEGFLFPDTYRFDPGVGITEAVRRMTERFDRVYGSLPETDISMKYSKKEIVTLASIIEKEATLAEERRHISGVFHNRLERGIALGADPTIRYALRKFSGQLRVSELKNPTLYNTRLYPGLPPGPICSPGKGSLEAAVAPLETDDMYFVARWDGSGAHDFSKTHAEHDRKKNEIQRRNRQNPNHAVKGKN